MSIASPLEQAMLKLINAERAAAGVGALVFDDQLNDAAEVHSSSMLVHNIFSHTGADGSSPRERMVDAGYVFEGANASGENIGFQSERGAPGLLDDVQDIHDGLMASPGHRDNILSSAFDEIGIGIVEGSFSTDKGTFNSVMVTQNFAKTDAVDQPVTTPILDVPTFPTEPLVTEDQPTTPELPTSQDTPTVDKQDEDLEMPTDPVPEDDDKTDPETETPVVDTPVAKIPEDDMPMDDETEMPEAKEEPTDLVGDTDDETGTETETPEEDSETNTGTETEMPGETTDTDFVFKGDEDMPEDDTSSETDTGGKTGYVWSKTHSDATYAKIIEDFTASCTEEAYAALDQELQAFVLREFDCNFDIA